MLIGACFCLSIPLHGKLASTLRADGVRGLLGRLRERLHRRRRRRRHRHGGGRGKDCVDAGRGADCGHCERGRGQLGDLAVCGAARAEEESVVHDAESGDIVSWRCCEVCACACVVEER